MSLNHSDVVVHIDETLDDKFLQHLKEAIKQEHGVFSTQINEHIKHLMVVKYNAENISALTILLKVKNQGVHAELIGL